MELESGLAQNNFYNAFKKVSGQTPNEYKNAIK